MFCGKSTQDFNFKTGSSYLPLNFTKFIYAKSIDEEDLRNYGSSYEPKGGTDWRKTRDIYEVEGRGKVEDCHKFHKYSKLNNLKNLHNNLQVPDTLTVVQNKVCVKKISSYFYT
jgi:hypothetical protein